jgi:hypothetical protein
VQHVLPEHSLVKDSMAFVSERRPVIARFNQAQFKSKGPTHLHSRVSTSFT